MNKSLAAEDIANCTCLRLRKAARRATQIYDQALEPSGVTLAQFSLLSHLYTETELSVGDLADALVTDPTTLSRNLKPLTERGLVKIVPDQADRRRRRITLTAAGLSVLPLAHPLWRKAQAHVAQLIGAGETERLNKALDRSIAKLTRDAL